MKGSWQGEWNADKSVYTGKYVFPYGMPYIRGGMYFEGQAKWVTTYKLSHHDGTGRVVETVEMPVKPHWEFEGSWYRPDGKGAAAPHMPEPPEERDDGSPPPEEDDGTYLPPTLARSRRSQYSTDPAPATDTSQS